MAVAPSFQPLIVPTIFPVIEENDEDTCITWLQNNGLLARGMKCKCGSIMRSGTFAGISEGRGWRCPEKSCKKFASLRIGSFFEGSKIPLDGLLEFVYFWAKIC